MILSVQPKATLTIPLSLIFWCNVVVYIFHIFEKSVLGEVFVMKVRRLYLHAYRWKHFAGTFFIRPLQVKLNSVFEKQGRKKSSPCPHYSALTPPRTQPYLERSEVFPQNLQCPPSRIESDDAQDGQVKISLSVRSSVFAAAAR